VPPPVILVADGEQRSALAVVRSLGRAGYRVHVGSATGRSLAGASRFSRHDHPLTPALADPAGFVDDLLRTADAIGADVVLPVTDPSVQALLDHRDPDAGGPRLPMPEREAYHALSDKDRVRELARSVGIPVPEQWIARDPESGVPAGVAYPVVAKPFRSVVPHGDRLVKTGVGYARDTAGLAAALRSFPAAAYPILVQERIAGAGEGQFLLRWDGEIRAAFAHRRLREKPPTGGQSVYRESVALEPELLELGRRLLDAVDWRGVAMVEYKRQAGTGTPYLMEVNGRFWGSLQLAVDAGVDFPRLLVEAALGTDRHDPAGAGPAYRVGLRSRWLWGDLDHLIARRRTPRAELPPDQPVGRAFARSFLRPPVGRDRLEVLRPGDPRPFLRETALWLRSLRA
jgi:predicted ATP-grasp superfamily ATP-dependent carboligase